jgi:hypothetical protein
MQEYFALVFLLAPGFIAMQTSHWLGKQHNRVDGIEAVMRYFSHSIFAMLFTGVSLLLLGLVPADSLTINYDAIAGSNRELLLMLSIVILVSFLTGALWQIVAKKCLLAVLNWINERTFGYHVDDDEGLMNGYIKREPEDKILRIRKNGREIVGLFLGISNSQNGPREIAIRQNPVYEEWIARAADNPDDPEGCFFNRTYLDLDSDVIIEEYRAPKGLFDK